MTKNTVIAYFFASLLNLIAFAITDEPTTALMAIWVLLFGIFVNGAKR